MIQAAGATSNQDAPSLKAIHARLHTVMMEAVKEMNRRGVTKIDPVKLSTLARRMIAKSWVSGKDSAINLRRVTKQPYPVCEKVVKAIPELNQKKELEAMKKAQLRHEEAQKKKIIEKAAKAIEKAQKKIAAAQAKREARLEKQAIARIEKKKADKECPDDLGEF